MRSYIPHSMMLLAGAALSWVYFTAIYKPSTNDHLVTTTSYYFKRMSELGLNGAASFQDCRVQNESADLVRAETAAIGLCIARDDNADYHYSIHLSETGKFLFDDFEEVRK